MSILILGESSFYQYYLTTTLHFSTTPLVFTVMNETPFFFAITLPLAPTVATLVLLDLNLAVPIFPLILSVKDFLAFSITIFLLSVGLLTMNLTVLETPLLVTVTVAVPFFSAVTLPVEDTFTTLLSLDF